MRADPRSSSVGEAGTRLKAALLPVSISEATRAPAPPCAASRTRPPGRPDARAHAPARTRRAPTRRAAPCSCSRARRCASARGAAAAWPGQCAHDPLVDDLAQGCPDGSGILVSEHADHGEGAAAGARQRPRAQLTGEHPRRRLVVGDVQDPFHLARHDLEAPCESHPAQCQRGGARIEGTQGAARAPARGASGADQGVSASTAAKAVAALRYWMAPASADGGSKVKERSRPR